MDEAELQALHSEIQDLHDENEALSNLVLWCARRLPKAHETFAHDELDKITGIKHMRS